MKDVAIGVLSAVYILAMFGGTAWLVDQRGWTPWWFLFTLLIVASTRWEEK